MFFIHSFVVGFEALPHQLRRGVLVCGRDGVCTWIHRLHVVNSTCWLDSQNRRGFNGFCCQSVRAPLVVFSFG